MTVKMQNERRKNAIRKRIQWIGIGSFMALLVILFLSLNAGFSKLPLSEVITTLLGKGTDRNNLILFSFRMPRIFISVLIGSGLALSGCIVQGVTRNPLADFGLLGISAGGGLMVLLYVLVLGSSVSNAVVLPILSFIGAMGASLLVYILAYKKQDGIAPTRLVLTGIAVQAGINALMTVLVLKLDETQYEFVASWQAGTIIGSEWRFVVAIAPWMLILIPYAFYKARYLDVLNLGETVATGLGAQVEREKRKLLLTAVALAASCVAVGGNISFVGLIAPHVTRKLIGARHVVLLPMTLLVGAILVSLADMLGRTLIEPAAIPTGIMTAILGAPYFIYLLMKTK